MSQVTEYVAGFMFTPDLKDMALIKKNRPAWQKDKCNAIGGHIEPSDRTPFEAMAREFQEETGMYTAPFEWRRFCLLKGKDFKVHFFVIKGEVYELKSMTDEEVLPLPVKFLTLYNTIPNLQWLVPLALLALAGKVQPMLTIQEGLVDE